MELEPKIYITRHFPGPAIDLLKKHYSVSVNPQNRPLTQSQLVRAVRSAEVLITMLTDEIDARIMDAAGKQLRLIANYAVGYDNIDLGAAKHRQITVTNTPDVANRSVAEHTFALLLATARRVVEADAYMRAKLYRHWEPELLLGTELHGKTLGIIGLGGIGIEVASIAKAFNLNVLYFDELRDQRLEMQNGIHFVPLTTLLKEADFITLHVPLLPTTHHLIGERELSLMKPSAILINTSRGPVIDEQALVHRLQHGLLWAAGLDVFEREPRLAKALEQLPNVTLTPHIASATRDTRIAMSQLVADNVMAFLEHGKAVTPVTIP